MRKPRLPLRPALYLAGALYALYLIAGNVFLNTRIGVDTINRRPVTFHARWTWALTLWPGHIYARDPDLGGQSRNVLWQVAATSAYGRIRLLPLLDRELRFAPIEGNQVRVAIRRASTTNVPPPWRRDAWRVAFDRIDTRSLRQVRIGRFVLEGEGNAQVRFIHQLRGGATEIEPSHLRLTNMRVRYGKQPLLHDARVDARFTLDPFTHELPAGVRKVNVAEGHVTLQGHTVPVALGANLQGAAAGRLSVLDGHVSADFSLDHGQLAPGGTLQWNAPVAITDADGSQQYRRGQLDLAVQADGVAIHARVPPLPGKRGAADDNQFKADLRYASRQVLPHDAPELLRRLSGTAAWRWHFASLRWIAPLLAAKPWLKLDGAGDIEGALNIDAGRLAPGSRVDIPHVALTADLLDNVFAGDARAQGRVVAGSDGPRTVVDMTVDRFTLAPRADAGKPYLQGNALKLDLRSSADLATFGRQVIARLHFADATIPDLRSYNRYLPGESLRFLGGKGRLGSDFTIDGKGDVRAGRMQFSANAAQLALGVSRLRGDLHLDTRLVRATRRGHAFDLEGFALRLEGMHVRGSDDPPWWARATLENGQLDWDKPMRLRGDATLVMKDVSLLLSLFADRSAFPKWIASLIDAGQATAHARVETQRGDFVLDRLTASNRRVDLLARLRVRDGQPRGDLYARWGVLGVGVALAGGKRDFHLLQARHWYEAQPDLLPADAPVP